MLQSLESRLLAINTPQAATGNSTLLEPPKNQNNQITGNIAVTSKFGFSPGEMTDHLICIKQT